MRRAPNPPVKFTQRWLTALKPGARRETYHDTEVRELGLMLHPTGRKVYFLFFRPQRGQAATWTTLGDADRLTVERAREAARLKLGQVAQWKVKNYEGDSPLAQPKPQLTFGELLEEYIQRHLRPRAKNPDALEKNVRWAANKYLADFLPRPLGRVTKTDVVDLLHRLGRTPRMANRCVQTLRTVYNFGRRHERCAVNPAAGVELFKEESRDRWLQGPELAKLFAAMKKLKHRDLNDFITLSLFTGARKSNVLSMRWQDLALDDNRWTITESKTKPYTVALAPEVVDLLRKRPRVKDSPWVFPGVGATGHVVDFKKPFARLLKLAGLTNVRQHDLRRTHGSWQANLGVPLNIIGKSLGHGEGSNATWIYSRLQLEPVRESVERAVTEMVKVRKKLK